MWAKNPLSEIIGVACLYNPVFLVTKENVDGANLAIISADLRRHVYNFK